MSHQEFSSPEAARSRLRATVMRIGREISRLPKQTTDGGGAQPNGLLAFYVDLVDQLALGPEPDVRACPVCKHIGRSAATLCGYCWTKLTPRDRPVGVAESVLRPGALRSRYEGSRDGNPA